MSWKEIFRNSIDWNEKSILGALSFAVMVLVMTLDLVTGALGKDLVIMKVSTTLSCTSR